MNENLIKRMESRFSSAMNERRACDSFKAVLVAMLVVIVVMIAVQLLILGVRRKVRQVHGWTD